MNTPKFTYPTYSADLVIQGPQGPPGLSGGNAVYNYLYSGGTAAIDPGAGGIAIQTTGGQTRRIAISKTDADGTGRRPEMLLTGDTVTVTDSPATPPVTGWARYVLTDDPVDNGTFVVFDALRTDSTGTQTPPPIGTPLRVYGALTSAADIYAPRDSVNMLPMPAVASWAALPPATVNDVGRRIHVTNGLGWLVAICVADPAPRWAIAPESSTGRHSVQPVNGWAASSIEVWRSGDICWLGTLNLSGNEAVSDTCSVLGPGWGRGSVNSNGNFTVAADTSRTIIMRVGGGGVIASARVTNISTQLTWVTRDAWPTASPADYVPVPEPR